MDGLPLGNFSDVVTQRTAGDGLSGAFDNPAGGFRDNTLDTGFFATTNSSFLSSFYTTLTDTGQVVFSLTDLDAGDNFYDFRAGVNGGLVNVGQAPNVAPVISGVSNSGPISEGGTATVRVSASDPDATAGGLTYEFDLDNSGSYEVSDATGVASRAFAENGSDPVNVRVTNARGGARTGATTVQVNNAAPTAAVTGGPAGGVPEGTAVSFGSAVADAGALGTHTRAWSVSRNGNPFALPAGAVTNAPFFAFTPTDDGAYAVTLTATDGDGGVGGASRSIPVANVAPTAAPSNTGPADEGSPVTVVKAARPTRR